MTEIMTIVECTCGHSFAAPPLFMQAAYSFDCPGMSYKKTDGSDKPQCNKSYNGQYLRTCYQSRGIIWIKDQAPQEHKPFPTFSQFKD